MLIVIELPKGVLSVMGKVLSRCVRAQMSIDAVLNALGAVCVTSSTNEIEVPASSQLSSLATQVFPASLD